VGDAAKKMDDKVGDSVSGFDKATDASDALDTKAMGFRDTVTGVEDSVKGFGQILKGDLSADALVTAGMGVGDLASGFTNLLGPALGSGVKWLAQTRVGMLAQAAASKVVSAATKVWAGVQWLMNAAMAANPLVLVVILIVALVAVIVLAYKKSDTFRAIVQGAFRAVGKVVSWLGDRFSDWWRGTKRVIDRVREMFSGLPGRIGGAFRGLFNIITGPFRMAFNFVARAWNNTVGRLRWSIPGWVPGIGGNSISAPTLPQFHTGGIASGAMGREFLAVLRAGESVSPVGGGGGGGELVIRSGGAPMDDLLVEILARAVSARGGLRAVFGPSGVV
jgi:hypothetical protein